MHLLSPLVCAVLVGNIGIEKGKEKVKTLLSKGLCKHTQSDGTTSFEGMERVIVGIADSKVQLHFLRPIYEMLFKVCDSTMLCR